ncbi:MAG: LysR family transcriptional regulator [Candidatus Acidiferrum sp.]
MNSTLDEWEILHAIVHLGGYAAAAQQLNRSQSTISYAIARLQDRLGIKLLELEGRKAHLTEAGRVLLADAEPHLAGFHRLEQRARSLASGGVSEIRLSVDCIYPNDRLFTTLFEFTRRFPYVHPRLRQATFLSSEAEFSAHGADLCVAALAAREYYAKPILEIKVLAVARWDHPLHSLFRPVARIDLIQHTIVTIEGAASGIGKRQPRSPAQRFLSVTTIEAAIDAVRSGLCFGWLPGYRIQSYLDSGELLPVHMPVGGVREVRLNIICRDLSPASRELHALAELLGTNRDLELI